ncbi:MAG: UDP-N-acetylmuramoyl-L-alanyl-D-glutamate--2,6-diaminopimelate ligase [Candidatus Eremiobacteraeota bacterium]|nr:UDP-N-acetylmuramoyl-L-alanyl-D-glutamate--2,6-diaminopimelate ligase [Candidatus Eremiobacteraeota bacterium]
MRMRLSHYFDILKPIKVEGDADPEVKGISCDSRTIKPGEVFFCLKGYKYDGHLFAPEAIIEGACAIVAEREIPHPDDVPLVYVKETRKSLALASSRFYGNPAENLTISGFTGTNGKTTGTYALGSIIKSAGLNTGSIGTLSLRIGDEDIPLINTTPESTELHKFFAMMQERGITHVNMEVSSHSLVMDRVFGINFTVAVFTNITREHFDFHKSMKEYLKAKLKLFKMIKPGGTGVICLDDPHAKDFINACEEKVVTYGFMENADVRAKEITYRTDGITFKWVNSRGVYPVKLKVTGFFNLQNLLGASAAALALNIPSEKIVNGLEEFEGIKGRFQRVESGQPFQVMIDYAHTPAGIESVLRAARPITSNKLRIVLGCGGDRDKEKRPLMGSTASRLADKVYLTSDNPRSEEPESIIADIECGMNRKSNNYEIEPDRRTAIEKALTEAREGDTVIIAGKGHEDYQIFSDRKIHFDDVEVAKEILEELGYEEKGIS